ncbi:MAG: AmmeMemoRadiSam system protein B, partial [Myxococcales bacterium]|nr:AmmeMemoRadiSam system protein B [Myxococcales bacterium]
MIESPFTRAPAVVGSFYPRNPIELDATVRTMLAEATPQAHRDLADVEALIVPHAGYVYSGPVAASAYAGLCARAGEIRKVVLLGPAHRVYLEGLALPADRRFATPLGTIEVDQELVARLAELPYVVRSGEAHAHEHSLEVQLPFLQRVLRDFSILPLVVGDATPAQVATVLERLWGGPETLI